MLDRADENDVGEAQEAIYRLANLAGDEGSAVRDIPLLQLRALLARAQGDDAAYADLRDLYRDMATSLGFEGHIAWAEAMTSPRRAGVGRAELSFRQTPSLTTRARRRVTGDVNLRWPRCDGSKWLHPVGRAFSD